VDSEDLDSDAVTDGSPAELSLPALLSRLASERRTGVLRIGDGGGSQVWLSEGRTYLVVTGSSPELAQVLFDGGLGTVDAIDQALDQALDEASGGASPAPPGAVDRLLAGYPAEHAGVEARLRRLLHEHNLSSLFELLVPTSASCRFEAGRRHPFGDRFATDTGELVDQAQRRMEIWRRIAARIPSTSAVFALAPALPNGVAERVVSADEWRFLARLNGTNTVADVISQTGESAFRVCSTLYRLLLENVVEDPLTSSGDRSA
jgi:hypothetical protein